MVFDNLNVRISADTINFSRKISSAQDDLGDLAQQSIETAGGLQILQNRADEAGDEIGGAGRKAGRTSGLFSTLSFTTGGLSSSFISLATTAGIATAAIGALTVGVTALSTTIVPLSAVLATVAGGAAALAGAFGLVVGSGILAFGEKLGGQNEERLKQIKEQIAAAEDNVDTIEAQIDQLEELRRENDGLTAAQQEQLETLIEERNETERLIDKKEELAKKVEKQTGIMGGLKDAFADLKEEITPIITDFGKQFIPLIEDAVDALPTLIDDIINASEAAGGFVDPLRRLGRIAFNVIPEMTFLMLEFAQLALPVFEDFIDFLRNNAGRALSGMLRITRELAPEFMNLFRAIISSLPEVAKLGTLILDRLIPAFTGFIQTVEDVINLAEAEGGLVGFIKALVNDALEWVRGSGIPFIQSIGKDLLSGITNILDPDGEGEGGFKDALVSRIKDLINKTFTWLNNTGLTLIGIMGSSIITKITNALDPSEGNDGGGFTDSLISRVKDLLDSTATWLTEGGGSTKISNFITSLLGEIDKQLSQISKGDIEEIGGSLETILGSVFDTLIASATSDEAESLGGRIGLLARTMVFELGERMLQYVFSERFVKDMALAALAVAKTFGAALAKAFSNEPIINFLFGEGTFEEMGAETLGDNESPLDEFISRGVGITQRGGGPPGLRQGTGTPERRLPEINMEVSIEGELPRESIKNVAVRVNESDYREALRNAGRNPTP